MTFIDEIASILHEDEGFRSRPYLDTRGYLTIGYGRNLDAKGISQVEADVLLRNDILSAQSALEHIYPGAHIHSTARYSILVQMVFVLGPAGFSSFRKMRAALEHNDYDTAAAEILRSRMAGQIPNRAQRWADIMRGGDGQRGASA